MKKSFGQNFLTDKQYLNKIIENINIPTNSLVLEIGAGSGNLTQLLARKVRSVYAVEVEREAIKKLELCINKYGLSNVQIIDKSFLKLNLEKVSKDPYFVVGNIPYNLSSKILLKLFGEIGKPESHFHLIKKVYLMLQLEVAERLVAKPGSKAYSPLTLLVQYFSNPEILFKVPKHAFYPIPKVDSAFVSFEIKKNVEQVTNPFLLRKVIKTAFQQRRKKIVNPLLALSKDKSTLIEVFSQISVDPNLRAEDLPFKDYLMLSEIL